MRAPVYQIEINAEAFFFLWRDDIDFSVDLWRSYAQKKDTLIELAYS